MEGIVAPSPFFNLPGELIICWEDWKEGFEAYVETVGGNDFTASRKLAMLKHCLGAEGRRVLKHLAPTLQYYDEEAGIEEFNIALQQLDLNYGKKKNEVVE